MQATSITVVAGNDFTLDLCSRLVHQTEHDLPEAPIRDTYATICNDFLSHDASKSLVASLSSQSKAVRRDELIFYLRLLNGLAIKTVATAFGRRGHAFLEPTTGFDKTVEQAADHIKQLFHVHSQVHSDVSDVAFRISETVTSQLQLIHEYNNDVPDDRRSWLFVVFYFPEYYVNSLERLIYPDWHTASFVANPTDASMWGAYGDGQRGACLKFRTRPDKEECRTLDLYRANSWSGGSGGIVAHYSYVPHRFEPIRYTADFPEIDFFQSLGIIPRFKLEFWYSGKNGERSAVGSRILGEDENWRNDYWRKFSESFSTKTPEWSHEQEYRLILYSHLQRFDDVPSRKLKYRFADLAGIIFGIKTTTADKIRIMRMVEQKCRAESRKDFEFHQAHYSHRARKIELLPLSLLQWNDRSTAYNAHVKMRTDFILRSFNEMGAA
jgi:hypothetical protein